MTDTQAPRRAQKRRRRRAPLVIGIILLALGVGSLSWFAWEFWGTNIPAAEAQKVEKDKLRQAWESPAPSASTSVSIGDGIAILRIPDFGTDWEQPVLKGTDADTLMRGLGWYTTTAQPGQIGNFAVAGHRSGHGRPFDQLLTLKPGAKIIVETRTYIYTYALDNSPGDLTVQNTDTWVLDPVPGKPAEKPTKALITLTTCQEFFQSPNRSIGFGHLVDTKKK